MPAAPCPGCHTRTRAFARLREMHNQLTAGVPLAEVRITA